MYSKRFWLDALERATATAAQFVLGGVGLSENALNVIHQPIEWTLIVSLALTGFVLSFLKALVALNTGKSESASLVGSQLEETR